MTSTDFIKGALLSIPFGLLVTSVPKTKRNYSIQDYMNVAPFYFGGMNMIFASQFQQPSYLLFGLISSFPVGLFAWKEELYNFTKTEWRAYFLTLYAAHTAAYFFM